MRAVPVNKRGGPKIRPAVKKALKGLLARSDVQDDGYQKRRYLPERRYVFSLKDIDKTAILPLHNSKILSEKTFGRKFSNFERVRQMAGNHQLRRFLTKKMASLVLKSQRRRKIWRCLFFLRRAYRNAKRGQKRANNVHKIMVCVQKYGFSPSFIHLAGVNKGVLTAIFYAKMHRRRELFFL